MKAYLFQFMVPSRLTLDTRPCRQSVISETGCEAIERIMEAHPDATHLKCLSSDPILFSRRAETSLQAMGLVLGTVG